jgi:peptidoglycan/LPS O-acetylase OafA/YrhL
MALPTTGTTRERVEDAPPQRSPHARIQYIDGLRAVAVLAVVWFHAGIPGLPSGFLGVDVFFVISGFVISRSLTQSAAEGWAFSGWIENFYRRRFWRLAPALVVMLGVVVVAGAFLIPPGYLSNYNLSTAIGAFTGTANLVLAVSSGGDYFGDTAGFNPFLHTWSLGVEEQFYVVFPLLLWWFLRARRGRAATRLLSASIVPGLAVISIALAAFFADSHATYDFYLIVTRFWELAAGVFAFLLADRVGRLKRGRLRLALGWLGLLLIVVAYLLPGSIASPFPGGILPVLGTVLVLWFAPSAGSNWATAGPLSLKPAVYIGRISYSLYLWHWPVIVLLHWTIGIDTWWKIATAIGLSFALGAASFHWVERPTQRMRLAKRSLGIPRSLVAVGTIAALLVGGWYFGIIRSGIGLETALNFTPVAQNYGWSSEQMPGVRLPKKTGDKGTLYVVGDSHAGRYNGVAAYVGNEHGLDVVVASHSYCGYTLLKPVPDDDTCAAERDALAHAGPGDVVLLAGLRMPALTDQDGRPAHQPGPHSATATRNRAAALAQLESVARGLHDRGVGVIVDSPKPVFEKVAYRCAEWFESMNPVCSLPASEPRKTLVSRAAPVTRSEAALQHAVPSVVVWDAFSPLCPATKPVCSEDAADGHPLVLDTHHLTGWANELLIPSFERAVSSALASR